MPSKLSPFASLFRPYYHHNFSIVIFGAFVFGSERGSLELISDLVMHYLTFTLCLYGGIYTMNAIADAPLDRKDPIKKYRPIPSGQISAKSAMFLAVVMCAISFAGIFAWEGCFRFWPIYVQFVVLNLAYSCWFRQTRYRFLIGTTAALRLHLGAMIGGNTPPWATYLAAASFMWTVQALKFRIEATGLPKYDSSVRGAPFELCVCLFLLANVLLCSSAQSPGVPLFSALSLVSFLVFIGAPMLNPRLAFLFGVQLPCKPAPSLRFRVGRALLELGDYGGLLKFALFLSFSLLNEFLMGLEETLFSAVLVAPRDKLNNGIEGGTNCPKNQDDALPKANSTTSVYFILGHQRSGTTALHEAALRHPRAYGATIFDIWCPSLMMKLLGLPLRPMLDLVSRCHDSPNHRVNIAEPAEEQLFLAHRCKGHALFMLFPALMRHPHAEGLLADAMRFSPEDVVFMRSCIHRVIAAAGIANRCTSPLSRSVYVARPLALTKDFQLLQAHFPEARFAVCAREPKAAMRSWVQLYSVASHVPLQDPSFQEFMRACYRRYSHAALAASYNLATPGAASCVLPVMFEEWTKSQPAVLQRVLSHLLHEEVPEAEARACILPAEIAHRNAAACGTIVEVDQQLVDAHTCLLARAAVASKLQAPEDMPTHWHETAVKRKSLPPQGPRPESRCAELSAATEMHMF